ncbi:MAG TPA: hypothetical protein VGK08_07435 [Thermoanaerobaculia bacterium]
MTESEGSTQGASSSPTGTSPAGARRKKTTRARRRTTGTQGKSAASGKKTASRRTTPRRSASRRRGSSKSRGLEGLLNDLAKRANRAGSTIADLSEEGADAARRTLGKVTATSRQTITRVKREWDRMDNTRKVQFVGALLAALGAAAAGVRKATKK